MYKFVNIRFFIYLAERFGLFGELGSGNSIDPDAERRDSNYLRFHQECFHQRLNMARADYLLKINFHQHTRNNACTSGLISSLKSSSSK